MKVRSTPRATDGVRQAIAYDRKHSPQTVETFKTDMRACRARLGAHPESALLTTAEGVRVPPPRRCPYLVSHAVVGDTLFLIDVRHAARERPPKFGSLP